MYSAEKIATQSRFCTGTETAIACGIKDLRKTDFVGREAEMKQKPLLRNNWIGSWPGLNGRKPIQPVTIRHKKKKTTCLFKIKYGMILLMNNAVAELLNTIRTEALKEDGNRELLSVSDMLEKFIADQDNDLQTTHQCLAAEQQRNREIEKANLEILIKLQKKEELCKILQTTLFGRSSEKWTPDENIQAVLFNELEFILHYDKREESEPADNMPETEKATGSAPKAKVRGKREKLPEHLPRVEKIIDISEKEKICEFCSETKKQIGFEASERLQMKPAEFFVERTIRLNYGCSCGCGGICTAPPEPVVYPKSILGETVIAQIITNKFCDGLPLYRQARVLSRSGIDLSRSTMARALGAATEILAPLKERLDRLLPECPVLCADETRLRVLKENGIKKEGNSYMWVVTGQHESMQIVRFHYGGRGADIAHDLLKDFHGTLMCDGYGAYPSAVKDLPIKLAACLAHVRRRFHDVLKADRKNILANEAMAFIAKLYETEQEGTEISAQKRQSLRQEKSKPVFYLFGEWLMKQQVCVMPHGALGVAINYAVKLLPRLALYLDDGNVPIDNNRAENKIRPFVIGRKAWLFNDQAEGAKVSAILYSLVETAKANNLEPFHYFNCLFQAYRQFGPAAMPWDELLPTPDLRSRVDKLGIKWGLS